MSKNIKRVVFAKNPFGLSWVNVDIHAWEIVDGCGAARHLINRACRLADRGMHLEYRDGSTYHRINACIEMMS